MVVDLHTHTFHSDGSLSSVELIRRAVVNGYRAIALTDHVGIGNVEAVLEQVIRDCAFCREYWDILAIPGVELTHVPARALARAARAARQAGARIVLVHGETIVEPVEPGTNRAAVECPDVDILAHPGVLIAEEVALAAANDVYLEVSARKGHCLGNGRTVALARAAGAKLVLNSDAHDPGDLLTAELARRVALGAGLRDDELDAVLRRNPQALVTRSLGGPPAPDGATG
ncbi:MAG: histidinol phosphate phosphatase domain-containing protein [Chloroflexi bacterium]|nr:histidinol phosphate phosphatase domain-containing protein [Chloroflexota bacterium]